MENPCRLFLEDEARLQASFKKNRKRGNWKLYKVPLLYVQHTGTFAAIFQQGNLIQRMASQWLTYTHHKYISTLSLLLPKLGTCFYPVLYFSPTKWGVDRSHVALKRCFGDSSSQEKRALFFFEVKFWPYALHHTREFSDTDHTFPVQVQVSCWPWLFFPQ